MAQHDYAIANQSGAAFRADLNNALAAIVSQNSGAAEPSTTYAYMPWADTTAGVMKLRNGANNAWITLYQLDGEWANIALENGTAAAPSLYFKDSGTDTGLFSAGTDQVNLATGGTERVKWGTSEVAFNDSGENYDFRIEGDTKSNLFFLDASADSVSVDGSFAVTGNANFASINGGQLAGMRNRIINGDMRIDQRNAGAAQTITAAAALAYSVDRWYAYCTGANVTGQRVQGASAGQFRYQFTGAASVTAMGFGQRIEQLNSADLAGTTATLSVDLANSVLTTVTWTAYYANTADTFGTLASPTRTQIATGTFTVNSTVTRYSANISVPATATTGIEIVFTVGAQTSGTWTIGNVQLEAGTVATPFERRSHGLGLALCQRYFEVVNGGGAYTGNSSGGIAFIAVNRGSAGEPPIHTLYYKATKRVVPTVSCPTGAGAIRYVTNTGVYSGQSPIVVPAGTTAMTLSCNSSPVASVGWMDGFGDILITAEL